MHKRGLQKIKQNPAVLQGLLSKSRKITTPTDGLGISFTNPNAKYNVIKVCNPYCGPCAKAHPILEELLELEKINLQVLFTATADKNDHKTRAVGHFLAINAQGDDKKMRQALDEWYLAEQKNYDAFANQYPMNGELQEQEGKIVAMSDWCTKEKITHTPTLFINGHELPKDYTVADLMEVLV